MLPVSGISPFLRTTSLVVKKMFMCVRSVLLSFWFTENYGRPCNKKLSCLSLLSNFIIWKINKKQTWNICRLTLCSYNLFEIWRGYFIYKRVSGFLPFCIYYLFMKLFLFQSKPKNVVKIWWRTKIEIPRAISLIKKNWTPFCKNRQYVNNSRLNWLEVGALQSKKCSPGSNCFLLTVLHGSAIIFLMKFSDMLMINPLFHNSFLKRMTDTLSQRRSPL